jgi:GNAT superfamily N-acetyltransferase
MTVHRHRPSAIGGRASGTSFVPRAIVRVVPFERTHASALERFFLSLSARSRYLRFLSPMVGTTAQQLRPLLEADGARHVAHVAMVDGELVGEARFVRLGADRVTAEMAISVADAWQGRGVGRRLLQSLVASAARHGVRRFSFDALAENRPALGLFRRHGARWVVRDGVAEGHLPATPPLEHEA